MNNDHPRLMKELQHPTQTYDYDGITGTWLLIPPKIHILMLALALPVIIWMLPFVHLKGNFRYLFTDYRYYIAGAVTLFCLASALLSLLKEKQVLANSGASRGLKKSEASPASNNLPSKNKPTSKRHPKIHLEHLNAGRRPKDPTTSPNNQRSQAPASTQSAQEKVAAVITRSIAKTAAQKASAKPLKASRLKPTASATATGTSKLPKKSRETGHSAETAPASKPSTKSQKNSKQMQLDL